MKVIFALEMTPLHNSVKGRRDQIFERLSKGYKVVYISKMENILSIIKNHPKDFLKYLTLEIIKQDENYYRVSLPAFFFPMANVFRWINKINTLILGLFISFIRRKIGIKEVDIWWIGYPYAVDFLKDKKCIVYDCFDEHLGWEGYYLKSTVKKIEQDLIRLADLSIFSASKLLENKGKFAKKTSLILNGTDYNHFYMPPKKSNNNSKIILYSGVISNWFDADLMEYCIDVLNEYTFWFVGPDRGNYLSQIRTYKNVEYFGFQEYTSLPDYYHKAQVCIIPFKIESLIENTNPIKLYEYLSSGKPIVTTKFPEAIKYKDDLYIANDKNEFLKLIRIACDENSIEKINSRQQLAFENSWDNRVEKIVEQLNLLK
jgi:glycosyltransferase involved in cell wall biosynthesis